MIKTTRENTKAEELLFFFEKSTRCGAEILDFWQKSLKFRDFLPFWEINFTCVILLSISGFFVQNFVSISRLSRREIG